MKNELVTPAPLVQAGFGVSAKHFKKATDRNRVKRLLRESYRLQKHCFLPLVEGKKNISIFIVYTARGLPEYQPIFEKMATALIKLNEILNEDLLADT